VVIKENEPVQPKRKSLVLIVSWVQPKVDDDLDPNSGLWEQARR
jgi:hypothetical protein